MNNSQFTIHNSLFIFLLLLLAAGLRFHRLDAQSFWNDEGNSARLSERSVRLIIEGAASDIHPPLYYLILRGWRELAGETEFGLRAFSAFTGVLTVAVTMALAKEVEARARGKGMVLALCSSSSFAGLLTAVSPPLIYYSQETRMYALLAFWAVLSTWLLFRIHNSQFIIHYSLFYFLTLAAGLYTHYFFPAVILGHAILVLVWQRQTAPSLRRLAVWAGMVLAALLLYLPWLPIFLNQLGGRAAVRRPFLQFLGDALRWLAFGQTLAGTVVWPTLAASGLLVIGVLVNWRRMWTTVVMLVVPLLFMFAAGTTQTEFFKFMVTAVPFLALAIASGELNTGYWSLNTGHWRLENVNLRSLLPTLFLILLLWGDGRSLQNLYFNPAYARADYRGIAARIAADNYANAGIILNAPNQWEVFTYYHREGAPVYPIPRNDPDPAAIDAELTDIAARHGRLYAIFWGEGQRDPQRLVEKWLDAHTFKATEEWVGDVRFVVYAVPDEPAAEMTTAVNLTFGDSIQLNGYTLANSELKPGEIVQATLFWQTAVLLDTRYKIFLHLVDENGQIVAQRDSEPVGGLGLTTTWKPGETIVDNHGLLIPTDAADGRYTLLLGFYDIADPTARLPIQSADALPLAKITVIR